LFDLLERVSSGTLPKAEARTIREAVKAALERLWRTGEILLEKPSLTDERRNVLHYLRDVFPSVLPALDERLRQAWMHAGYDVALLSEPGTLPRLRFGTWVGGDRDGHPGVTAEVTGETLERLRVNALLVIAEQLTSLSERLSLSAWMQSPPTLLIEGIARLEAALGSALDAALALSQRLNARAYNALASIKELINAAPQNSLSEHMALEKQHFVNNLHHPNAGIGIAAFLDKQTPRYKP
jgi:phosphoenolpyruvate carboxylase